MEQNDRQIFMNYKKSTAIPLLCTDRIKWPIGSGRAGAKCYAELASEIADDVNQILKNGIDSKQVGALFMNPTRIFRMSHHIIRSFKISNIDKKEIQKIMKFFFDVIAAMKAGSVFNDDGYNLIFSNEEVDQLEDKKLSRISLNESKKLHRLVGLLWTYSEALFFVAHEVCVEIHGLYRRENKSYLVRDYINLAPTDLWPDLEMLPYNKIRIISEYRPELDLEFDVYNNHYIKNGNFADDLLSATIEIDEETIELGAISDLIEKVQKTTLPIIRKVSEWSEIEQAKKYVEIFWYRKKPLRDILNKEWYPPKTIFGRIDAEGIPPEREKATAPEKVYQLIDLL